MSSAQAFLQPGPGQLEPFVGSRMGSNGSGKARMGPVGPVLLFCSVQTQVGAHSTFCPIKGALF